MWSLSYDRCLHCGTNHRKHIARGLCIDCYRKDIEDRHKDKLRKRGIAGKILTKHFLLQEYLKNGKSMSEIANEASCSRQYVYKRMALFDLTPRNKKLARDLALKRGKVVIERIDSNGLRNLLTYKKISYKEDFFNSWSPEMAYVLGVIYSDGNMHPGKIRDPNSKTTCRVPRVTISQKEPELLKKVLALMGCNAKIYFRGRKIRKLKRENSEKEIVAGELHWFNIHGDKVYDELINLGLKPNKSLTVDFPKIPAGCVRHFIRGCWDGDGTVYVEKRSGQKKASYISGSKKFIQGMLVELEKAGFSEKKIYEIKRKNVSYYFRISGADCDKLWHFLYDGVPPEQYLERKYNLFRIGTQ